MNIIKRRLFFWSLVLLFFVIAPAIVLYARGFRFDLHRGVFVHSGTLTIKSNPQSIDVSLNNSKFESKTLNRINNSYNLSGLLPRNYDVKISAPDFQTWSKKTDVHSGLASEFWNVLLVRNSYEKIALKDTSGIDTFYISPKNKFIAYTVDPENDLSIKILNIDSKKTEQSFDMPGWHFIDEGRRENIEWSPEEDYLSVPVKKEIAANKLKISTNQKPAIDNTSPTNIVYSYFIIDPKNNSSFSLNELLKKDNIERVRWDPKNKEYVFFLANSSLFRANVKNLDDLTLISENVSSFDLNKDGVYFTKMPNNLVFKASFDGQNTSQITSSYPGNGDDVIDRLIVYDEFRMALIAQNKNLVIYNDGEHDKYFKKIENNAEGIHFSDDGKKMLFWNNNEIFVYFLRDWKVAPERAENDMTSITRYSEPIKNVGWFKDYEHVIFNTGKWTKIIELDPRDHRNCMDLISTNTQAPFVRYNNYWEFLYFTDNTDGNTTLNYIVFPEPTTFLGIGG